MMRTGYFITFEGIDGCGKTTQALRLAASLEPLLRINGLINTREPGGSFFGEEVRRAVFDIRTCVKAETLLFFADRAQHVNDLITPCLENHKVIICDRYYDSTLAYQSGLRGERADFIQLLIKYVALEAQPDITFLLDLPVEEAVRRLKKSGKVDGKKFDDLEIEKHELLRAAYLKIAKVNDRRITVLDGQLPPEELNSVIHGTVLAKLKEGRTECLRS